MITFREFINYCNEHGLIYCGAGADKPIICNQVECPYCFQTCPDFPCNTLFELDIMHDIKLNTLIDEEIYKECYDKFDESYPTWEMLEAWINNNKEVKQ